VILGVTGIAIFVPVAVAGVATIVIMAATSAVVVIVIVFIVGVVVIAAVAGIAIIAVLVGFGTVAAAGVTMVVIAIIIVRRAGIGGVAIRRRIVIVVIAAIGRRRVAIVVRWGFAGVVGRSLSGRRQVYIGPGGHLARVKNYVLNLASANIPLLRVDNKRREGGCPQHGPQRQIINVSRVNNWHNGLVAIKNQLLNRKIQQQGLGPLKTTIAVRVRKNA